jgi:heme/copper-type cytochrome/quinol oxidase subunit 4
MAATKEQVRDRNRRISKMRIAALFGLAAVMLAVIVTVAPQATVMTSEISAEAVVIDFFSRPAPVQTAAR